MRMPSAIITTKKICLLSAGLLLCLVGCSERNPRVITRLNESAALTGDLRTNPLRWKVITSAINHQDAVMYTVFGNDEAVHHSRTSAQQDYPAGSVISLVTWSQQEDPRWFGGRIPQAPKSVEFVAVKVGADRRPDYLYEDYEGNPLKKVSAKEGQTPEGRAAYLLSQRAAVMP
jgi:Cytochrome P460